MHIKDLVTRPMGEARAALREHLTGMFKAHAEGVVEAMILSPIVGSGPAQIDARKTYTGFRDNLSYPTLLALACERISLNDCLRAVLSPGAAGYGSKRSKTGYEFGRPVGLTDNVIEDIHVCIAMGAIDFEVKASAPAPAMPASVYPTTTTTKESSTMVNISDIINASELGALVNVVLSKLREGMIGDKLSYNATITSTAHEKLEVAYNVATTLPAEVPVNPIEGDLKHVADIFGSKPEPVAVEAKASGGGKLSKLSVPADNRRVIDAVLEIAKLPDIETLVSNLNSLIDEVTELKAAPKVENAVYLMPTTASVSVAGSGVIPNGTLGTAKASDVFGIKGKSAFDCPVPMWTWDAPHPYVPAIDPDYVFRPMELMAALYSLITGDRAWAFGHTGTGKSTLWEQIAARLNWPIRFVSFDSEITRADLIGQHVLVNDGGTTISKWVDGIVPQCMAGPYILVFDEMDFVRPDVAYVVQRVLELKNLTITEDGGRIVSPNPMFRIVATANTQGQGDDFGMYAGARVQSSAMLDRFTTWIKVDYLSTEDRKALLDKKVSHLPDPERDFINRYVDEHINAFTNAKVVKPISPRGMLAVAHRVAHYISLFPPKSEAKAREAAFESTIFNACTPQDRVVLKGIFDRLVTSSKK